MNTAAIGFLAGSPTPPLPVPPNPNILLGAENGLRATTNGSGDRIAVLGSSAVSSTGAAQLDNDTYLPMNGFLFAWVYNATQRTEAFGGSNPGDPQGFRFVDTISGDTGIQVAFGSLAIFNSSGTNRFIFDSLGDEFNFLANVGFGVFGAAAFIHTKAGTAAANNAPFQYTAGVAAQTALQDGAKNFDGSNEFLTVSGRNYTMAKSLTGTNSITFGTIFAGFGLFGSIAVPGAALGDVVSLDIPASVMTAAITASTFISFTAWVVTAGVVQVQCTNTGPNDVTLAAATFRASVVKY